MRLLGYTIIAIIIVDKNVTGGAEKRSSVKEEKKCYEEFLKTGLDDILFATGANFPRDLFEI